MKNQPVTRYPQLLESLAKEQNLPKAKVRKIVDSLFVAAARELKNGKRVQVGNLGILHIREIANKAAGEDKKSTLGTSKRVVLVASKKFRTSSES